MTLKIEVEVQEGENPAVVAAFLRETAERLEGNTPAVVQEHGRIGFGGGPIAPRTETTGKIGFRHN